MSRPQTQILTGGVYLYLWGYITHFLIPVRCSSSRSDSITLELTMFIPIILAYLSTWGYCMLLGFKQQIFNYGLCIYLRLVDFPLPQYFLLACVCLIGISSHSLRVPFCTLNHPQHFPSSCLFCSPEGWDFSVLYWTCKMLLVLVPYFIRLFGTVCCSISSVGILVQRFGGGGGGGVLSSIYLLG